MEGNMLIRLLVVYWVIADIALYVIRIRRVEKGSRISVIKKTPAWKHVVYILLFPLFFPFSMVLLLRSKCRSAFYKNRPRPLPKRLRKYMQSDCVLDERNHTVSIAEYNYMHNTNYSLDDVYGKGYMDSLPENERETIMKQIATCGELKIQDNLPDTLYTRASVALGKGIVDGDFDEFESMLSNQVKNINYKLRTITGKSEVLEYWKGWRTRYVETKKVQKFEVAHSNYYSNTCLLLENMIVMFIIHDGLIAMTFMSPRVLNEMVGHKGDLLDFPFELDSIRHCLTKIKAPSEIDDDETNENRMPCLTCGTPSEKLEWYSSLFEAGYHGYQGLVSVCPHCHKVVEYYPRIRIRYREPVS